MTLQLIRVSLIDGSKSRVGTAESLNAADKVLLKLATQEARATNGEAVRCKDGYHVVPEPDHSALYTFEAPSF